MTESYLDPLKLLPEVLSLHNGEAMTSYTRDPTDVTGILFLSALLVGFLLGGYLGSKELLQVNVGQTPLSSDGEASPSR